MSGWGVDSVLELMFESKPFKWRNDPVRIMGSRSVMFSLSDTLKRHQHEQMAIDRVTYQKYIAGNKLPPNDRQIWYLHRFWPRYQYVGTRVDFCLETGQRSISPRTAIFTRELAICWVDFPYSADRFLFDRFQEYREDVFNDYLARLYTRMGRFRRTKKYIEQYLEIIQKIQFTTNTAANQQYCLLDLPDLIEERNNIYRMAITW